MRCVFVWHYFRIIEAVRLKLYLYIQTKRFLLLSSLYIMFLPSAAIWVKDPLFSFAVRWCSPLGGSCLRARADMGGASVHAVQTSARLRAGVAVRREDDWVLLPRLEVVRGPPSCLLQLIVVSHFTRWLVRTEEQLLHHSLLGNCGLIRLHKDVAPSLGLHSGCALLGL